MKSTFQQITRSLARSPIFATAAVLTLGLGIGATAAAFSVINAVLFRPLPYPHEDRLVVLRHSLIGIGVPDAGLSLGTLYHYRHHSRTVTSIAAYSPLSLNLSDANGTTEAERVHAADVTANFMSTLGVAPARGRAFVSADERPGTHVAVISDELWRRRYGANQRILNTSIQINGEAYAIVGVMPPDFRTPEPMTAIWRPLQLDSLTPHAGSFSLGALARLAPGATPRDVQAELNGLLPRLSESYPDLFPTLPTAQLLAQAKAAVVVRRMRDAVVGDFARALWVVATTVALLLLVTLANVSNLLLVRAQGRGHELAVRTALGANRTRLVARFFGEAGVLAMAGAVAGVVFAFGATSLLVRYGPANFPRLASVHVDVATIMFTIATAALATLACGALPALRFESVALGTFLRDGGRSATGGRTRRRAQRVLIVVQVSLAVVLLGGSGLLARTEQRLSAVQPGFDASKTLAFTISLPQSQYAHSGDIARFYSRALQQLAALPGVSEVGIVSRLPLSGPEPLAPVYVEHAPLAPNTLPPVYPFTMASPGYFRAMHITLLAGRLFTNADEPTDANSVIVSRAFAVKYWHDPTGRAAIGQRVRIIGNHWSPIVGVVESVRDTSLMAAPMGQTYVPLSIARPGVPDSLAPFTAPVASIVLRTQGDSESIGVSVRRELRAIDANVPVYDLEPLTDLLARATARTRFVLIVLGAAAAVTLLLGAIGLYGVIAYVVALRTRELGLRLALGAQPGSVLGLVLRDGFTLAAIGVLTGLVAFAGIGRFLQAFLFGVGPADPLTLCAVAATLLIVAGVASAAPAWRASRIDPLKALRAE